MSFPTPTRGAGSPVPHGFVLGPDDGEPYWWLGSLTLTKVGAGASGGGLDIVDHRVPPGYTPPRHVHTNARPGPHRCRLRGPRHPQSVTWGRFRLMVALTE